MLASDWEGSVEGNFPFNKAVTRVLPEGTKVVSSNSWDVSAWTKSRAESFTMQLLGTVKYDNEANGPWPELAAAIQQLIDLVIPRLLGVLQSEGRDIKPSLWSMATCGSKILASTGNQARLSSSTRAALTPTTNSSSVRGGATGHSTSNRPVYMRQYWRHIEPSEPAEEWDDRNRLYSIHPYLVDSGGHPGSGSRQMSYKEMLYLCEKYRPLGKP